MAMRVLVACEFSGHVREAFRARGHEAMSCDLLPSDIPGPHYQGDIRDVLNESWDLLVGFPPCTYLTLACTWRWTRTQAEIADAAAFFLMLWQAPIPRIALENPPGWINSHILKPSQTIHPWMFGAPYTKATSLWLKGLPPLMATRIVPPTERNRTYIVNMPPSPDRAKRRSITPLGLAEAMAAQWGRSIENGAA